MTNNPITLLKTAITLLSTDAIVNAANEGLWGGGGVCGAIFRRAGYELMTEACRKIGHCATVEGAWRKALEACRDFVKEQPEYEMEMVFAIISDEILEIGNEVARCVI